jgi:hypothetical protein
MPAWDAPGIDWEPAWEARIRGLTDALEKVDSGALPAPASLAGKTVQPGQIVRHASLGLTVVGTISDDKLGLVDLSEPDDRAIRKFIGSHVFPIRLGTLDPVPVWRTTEALSSQSDDE